MRIRYAHLFKKKESKRISPSKGLARFTLLMLTLAFQQAGAVSFGDSQETVDMAQRRVDRRFAAGLVAGGRTGIMGLDAEVNITESISAAVSLGTGIDYTTVAFRGRFYLLAKYVNPFVGFGYAKWYTDSGIQRSGDLNPRALVYDLMAPSQLETLAADGFNLDLLTPEIGVQFMSDEHYAITGSFIYLTNIAKARGTPYGEITLQWFF